MSENKQAVMPNEQPAATFQEPASSVASQLVQRLSGTLPEENTLKAGDAEYDSAKQVTKVAVFAPVCLTCQHVTNDPDDVAHESCHVTKGNIDCPAGRVEFVYLHVINGKKRLYARIVGAAKELMSTATTPLEKAMKLKEVLSILGKLDNEQIEHAMEELGILQ